VKFGYILLAGIICNVCRVILLVVRAQLTDLLASGAEYRSAQRLRQKKHNISTNSSNVGLVGVRSDSGSSRLSPSCCASMRAIDSSANGQSNRASMIAHGDSGSD